MLNIDSWIRFVLTEVYAVLVLAFVFRKPMLEYKRNTWLKILLVMLAMYLAHLFYVLLSPTYFFRRFSFSLERLNPVPFRVLSEWLAHPLNFFGNVLLFMPLGVFEILLHPCDPRRRQLFKTLAVSAGLSLFIEFAQCFTYRVPDVDDIILNTIGGLFGALLCMLMQRIGFDRTRVGRVLLPRIPRSWHRHVHLNHFCVILVVSMEVVMFAANYIVTIPRPKVREFDAGQTAIVIAGPATPEPAAEAAAAASEAAAAAGTAADAAPVPETAAGAVPEAETQAAAPEPARRVYDTSHLELEAQNVLLVRLSQDSGSAEIIYAADSRAPIYPASTIKMLTALTVLDIAEPGESVHLGTEIYIPPLDASRAGLEYGMTLTVWDLLEGLLLPSGADAAYALGVYCGRKLEGNMQLSHDAAVGAFVAAMNRKAAELGAADTTAVNVVGVDAKGQLTTAEDVLRIAKAFLDQPVLAEICCLPTDSITSLEGKSVSLTNTNKMLIRKSRYFNGDVAGVKTGTTNKAGNCLVSVFNIQGDVYLCVVMNSSYDGKFTDTQKLYDICRNAQI